MSGLARLAVIFVVIVAFLAVIAGVFPDIGYIFGMFTGLFASLWGAFCFAGFDGVTIDAMSTLTASLVFFLASLFLYHRIFKQT